MKISRKEICISFVDLKHFHVRSTIFICEMACEIFFQGLHLKDIGRNTLLEPFQTDAITFYFSDYIMDSDSSHKLVRRSSLGKGSKKRRLSKKKYDSSSMMVDIIGVSDMVLLDPLTEDALMQNLEKRFKAGEIYVSD